MIHRIKRTVKDTAFYALGNIAPKLSGFLLLPIYTKLIPVSAYGILGILELIEMLAIQLLSLGLHQALLRWHGLADTEPERRRLTFTVFIFLLVVTVLTNLLVLPWRDEIASLILKRQVGHYFLLIFASISFVVLSRIILTLLRSEQKSAFYALAVFSQFTLNLLANIFFVAVLKMEVGGILAAQALSAGALFLSLLPYLSKRMTPKFDALEMRKMASFGYPLIFGAVAGTILNIGDRFILQQMATLAEVGQYTLAYKFANIMKMALVDAFALGLPAIGWKIIREDDNPKRFFSKSLTYLVFCLLWFGLALSVYSKGLIHKFALNQSYWAAADVVPILALTLVFAGMQRLFFFELEIPKKTKSIAIIIGCAAAVNIVLNILLIPYLGITGAAIASLLAQLVSLGISYSYVQRAYPVRYEVKRILTLGLVAILLFYGSTLLDSLGIYYRIMLKGLLILSFPAILYSVKFYEVVELQRIREIFHRPSKSLS